MFVLAFLSRISPSYGSIGIVVSSEVVFVFIILYCVLFFFFGTGESVIKFIIISIISTLFNIKLV